MSSIALVVVGMVLLALSLVARYNDAWGAATLTSWAGSLLVIVGVGKMLFLDK